jgi:hypothetical protein
MVKPVMVSNTNNAPISPVSEERHSRAASIVAADTLFVLEVVIKYNLLYIIEKMQGKDNAKSNNYKDLI